MSQVEKKLSVAFSASKFAERRSEISILEHSLEFVARINQVNYINDSRATTLTETWNSLQVIKEDVVLIIGGIDRGNDYNMIRGLVKEKVKGIVCLGSEREKIFSTLMDCGMTVHALSLEEALKLASYFARPGYTVLFSPACPSYDAFDNYKNRGIKFKQLVSTL